MARKPLTLITPMRTAELLEMVHAGFETAEALAETEPELSARINDLATSVMSILAIVFRNRECTLDGEMMHQVMCLRDDLGWYQDAA